MRPDTFLRYAFALAFVLAGSGWLTTATAQSLTAQSLSATSPDGPTASLRTAGLQTLVDQSDTFTSGLVSQVNIDTPDFDINNADDFTVPEGVTWTVQQVFADGFYSASTDQGDPQCTSADIGFWSSAGTTPDAPLFLYEGVAPTSDDAGALTFDIDDTELATGTYWLSVQCEGALNFDTADDDGDPVDIRRWNWFRNDNNDGDNGDGNPAVAINPGGAFGFPAAGWNDYPSIGITAGLDLNFILAGFSEGTAQFPELALSPSSLMFELEEGGSDTETLTISNEGDDELTFSFPGFEARTRIAELMARGINVNSRRFETSTDLPKGTEPRTYSRDQSTMAQYRVAGPDAFGYIAIDSDEEGGPAYDFVDISSTGTLLEGYDDEDCTFGDLDEGNVDVELPFSFPFYGGSYSTITVNVNGVIIVDTPDPLGCNFTNDPLPDVGAPNGGIIAPLWDDYNTTPNVEGEPNAGDIYVQALMGEGGEAEAFVIQFNEIERFGGTQDGLTNTFQAILYPNGSIKYQYGDLFGTSFSYSIGIENLDGTVGLQVARDEDYAVSGLAVLITQSGQFITDVSPASGSVAAGASQDVMVTVDGLSEGSYTDYLVLNSNDEDEGTVFVPASIEVSGGGGGEQVSLPITFEDENVDYELTDFGGAVSMLVPDPEDATNTVVETNQIEGAKCFAGTTVADATGFDMPIPFAEGETTMSVRVWSPEAGVRVRFKVEKFDDPTVSVESDEFTTVAGEWETLVYDFTDQVPGTAELNFDSEYTKASIFFNFSCGIDPPPPVVLGPYYWDDITFGVPDMGTVTIAEARDLGDGAMVTVSGTVTRAEGAFTYFQDETAGLTIRQTSGEFFDDVADGTIASGTEIEVTGTLSSFSGLQQINGGDLASYMILGDGDVPDAQEVDLAELVANGEDYEAELVVVDDLTIDGMGTFSAGTSYTVTDETASDTLRVPNADDSEIDGTDIPEGEFTFTGVVGQFDDFGDNPEGGYQLLAIAEGDVEPQGPAGLIEFDPSPLVEMLSTGETGTESVTISNNSEVEVAYDFVQYSGDDPERASATSSQPSLELAKGEDDPRGYTQSFGAGGPDAFGYEWIDSNEPGGPAFEVIDISGTGTEIVEADLDPEGCTFGPLDEGNALVELPFDFSFYGETYSSLKVNINGNLNFNADGGELPCAFTNDPLPDAGDPNGGIIAPLWDDFDMGPEGAEGGQIFYETLADGRFVVQYDNIERFGTANDGITNTFQVILSPSGAIKYQYVDLNDTAPSYSIGIENPDGTIGLEVAMGSDYAEEGLAVLIQARPSFVTDVTPATGTIPAGGSVSVDVNFSAEGLLGGTYEGALNVDTDLEADPSTFDLPVVLEVAGMAECMLALDGEFEDTIVGTTSEVTATVTNGGTDTCSLTSASADDPFSVDGFEATDVAPGSSYSFSVLYSPTEAGDDAGTLTVEVDGDDDLTADLSATGLDEPTPEVSVESLSFEVEVGDTDSETFTISNVGGEDAADLEFSISVMEAPTLRGQVATLTAETTGEAAVRTGDQALTRLGKAADALRKGQASGFGRSAEVSAGRAPVREVPQGTVVLERGGDASVAFGHDATGPGTGTFVTFDFSDPATVTPINPINPAAFFGAGALGVDDDIAYQADGSLLYSVDTGTGVPTLIGDLGTELSGMTYDPATGTYYGISFTQAPTPTPLFEVDVETATLTEIGTGDYSTGIALAATPGGKLYTYDIANDVLIEVSKDSGVATVVGPIGFDANFGQGMTYDYVNDVMTMAAFNFTTFVPELRTVDLETGNTTLVGVLGVSQLGWVGAPAGAGFSLVQVSPESGTLEPDDSETITVTVDATDVEPGTYNADLVIATNDPSNPTLTIPVTVVVTFFDSNEGDGVPTEFALSQNYPNPFASSTTIEYALPEAARVTITVYDAVGRRVAVLVDEDLTTGFHTAEWDTRGLASGVYLYRIQAGDFVKTKKMSLVR